MIAQRTLLPGPQAQDSVSGAFVQRIGFELDADASQAFEGVAKHQVLRLGVHRRSLPRASDPGPPDLYPPVGQVDAAIASAADGTGRGALDGGKGQGSSLPLRLQGRLDVLPHLVPVAHGCRNPAPQLLVEAYLA